jgi:hypothetical protein
MRIRMEITRKFEDPLTRQANEAVRINIRSKNPGELLNSKSEFNHPPLDPPLYASKWNSNNNGTFSGSYICSKMIAKNGIFQSVEVPYLGPQTFCLPLWVQISKFSELYDADPLNLYLRMPGTMQNKSAQSDHHARRKRPKCGPILLFQNIQIFMNVLDAFS